MPTSLSTSQPHTPGTVIHAGSPLNNPEQIRTNLNKPERRQAPRPDRGALRIAQNPPDQNNPEQALPHLRPTALATGISPRPDTFHSVIPALPTVIPAQAGTRSPPSFLRRQERAPHRHSCAGRNARASAAIPAQAGTRAPTVIPAQAGTGTTPIHLSPLPGGRLRGGLAQRACGGG